MKAARKTRRQPAAKPVTETLLELAYMLHATKVVGVRPATEPRRPAPARRLAREGSPLAG